MAASASFLASFAAVSICSTMWLGRYPNASFFGLFIGALIILAALPLLVFVCCPFGFGGLLPAEVGFGGDL